jgi:hypothetical protein
MPGMKELSELLNELKSKILHHETLNDSVSKSSVGWHIEHTLMTIIKIINSVEHSDHQNYSWKFNLTRTLVFAINKIPRGKGKAPQSVQPVGPVLVQNLYKKIEVAAESIKHLPNLHPNQYFDHPRFGQLNLRPAIRFLEIHTRHHLKIINDIIQV